MAGGEKKCAVDATDAACLPSFFRFQISTSEQKRRAAPKRALLEREGQKKKREREASRDCKKKKGGGESFPFPAWDGKYFHHYTFWLRPWEGGKHG